MLSNSRTFGYFCFSLYHTILIRYDRLKGFMFLPIFWLLSHPPHFLFPNALLLSSSQNLPSSFSAPVVSFVPPPPAPDSSRGLIHVRCLNLFMPSNLCCQVFYHVWMASRSCGCAEHCLWVSKHSLLVFGIWLRLFIDGLLVPQTHNMKKDKPSRFLKSQSKSSPLKTWVFWRSLSSN